jgi:ABC-2 type transport system ATP-binding protein
MSETAIQTNHLTKVFKGDIGKKPFTALDDLDLEVREGEVYAFLGPNGAGKTTTIKLLTRLLFPTSGSIQIAGKAIDSRKALEKVGYLPEQPSIYGYLTGREFLDFVGRIFGLDRITRQKRVKDLLALVGLGDRGDHAIRGYSRGMLQRLGLAQALMNDPQILILDEPVSNLDPIGRREVRDIILRLKEESKTIFFSSHILSDAEMIADRVGILHQGKLVQVGTLAELTADQTTCTEVTFEIDADAVPKLAVDQNAVIQQDNCYMIPLCDADQISKILKAVDKEGGRVISVVPQRKNLEDVFMSHLGR